MGVADARPEVAERDDIRAFRAVASLEQRLERLPDSHPASPRYVRESKGPAESETRPLTDAEHAEHVGKVRVALDDARKSGLATHLMHTVDQNHKIWSDERDALHDQIVNDLYARAADVPCEREAILAGGLPGSGKTTVLTEHAGIDLSRYLMINPDLIKEEMARRGLMPVVDGLSPMEASDLVHEESSRIAKRLAHKVQGDGMNVIWDVTMSEEKSTVDRLDNLKAEGYSYVAAIFVDIPLEVSVNRADSRHREGTEAHRSGDGFGGRYVPPELIRNQADSDWGSQNRRTFENVKQRFDAWSRYDNSVDGRPPTIAEASSDSQRRAQL
jgi:predicted kinase